MGRPEQREGEWREAGENKIFASIDSLEKRKKKKEYANKVGKGCVNICFDCCCEGKILLLVICIAIVWLPLLNLISFSPSKKGMRNNKPLPSLLPFLHVKDEGEILFLLFIFFFRVRMRADTSTQSIDPFYSLPPQSGSFPRAQPLDGDFSCWRIRARRKSSCLAAGPSLSLFLQ